MTLDAYDEAGKAALTFAIPAGFNGAQTLHVAVAGTGTTVDLPITVAGQTGPFQGSVQVAGNGKVQAGGPMAVRGAKFTPGRP
jgi:5'-nucleotidase